MTNREDRLDNKAVMLLQCLLVSLGEADRQLFVFLSLRSLEGNLGEFETAAEVRRKRYHSQEHQSKSGESRAETCPDALTGRATRVLQWRCASSRPFLPPSAIQAWPTCLE